MIWPPHQSGGSRPQAPPAAAAAAMVEYVVLALTDTEEGAPGFVFLSWVEGKDMVASTLCRLSALDVPSIAQRAEAPHMPEAAAGGPQGMDLGNVAGRQWLVIPTCGLTSCTVCSCAFHSSRCTSNRKPGGACSGTQLGCSKPGGGSHISRAGARRPSGLSHPSWP